MDSGDDEKLVFDSIFGVFSFCFVFEELIENIVIARNYQLSLSICRDAKFPLKSLIIAKAIGFA